MAVQRCPAHFETTVAQRRMICRPGVSCTGLGSAAPAWGQLHRPGVRCTGLGSAAPAWGPLHRPGVRCTGLGSAAPAWGQLHRPGVSCTGLGSAAPAWGQLHRPGVSCTGCITHTAAAETPGLATQHSRDGMAMTDSCPTPNSLSTGSPCLKEAG
ncbi:hypothetical protein NDU88_001611 [Pleurodeles waltl]|uniref:Uncharacterized protein n=1 Tax=Pleurodeles waltl TaxID=8319 RepID=A0AAV7R9K7_PLEWA|nr:hypothetical protein NDU88_001611 [Pleurodeles waltl]